MVEELDGIGKLLMGVQNESSPHADRLHQTRGNMWLVYFTGRQENKLLAVSSFFKPIPLGLDSKVFAIYEEHKGRW